VHISDEKIVALASVNQHSPEQMRLELTCECAREYRRNGYARSVLIALIEHLKQKGNSVVYCCSRYNYASVALAKSIRLLYSGKFFAYSVFIDR